MSLAEGLARLMESRGLTTREVLARLGEQKDRATVYRLLAGQTENPRLDTFLSLCAAMDTTPNELLDQSEVFAQRPRSADAFDLRLRVAFRRLQALPAEVKAVAITQVLLLMETWERAAESRSLEELLDLVDKLEPSSR
jgi:transcriptional regulator with XRE-family HTH domain